jgi:phospholipase/lecithinase/hemolysin
VALNETFIFRDIKSALESLGIFGDYLSDTDCESDINDDSDDDIDVSMSSYDGNFYNKSSASRNSSNSSENSLYLKEHYY